MLWCFTFIFNGIRYYVTCSSYVTNFVVLSLTNFALVSLSFELKRFYITLQSFVLIKFYCCITFISLHSLIMHKLQVLREAFLGFTVLFNLYCKTKLVYLL